MRISALSHPTFAVRLENKELRNHPNKQNLLTNIKPKEYED